jgi:hypothetical protein
MQVHALGFILQMPVTAEKFAAPPQAPFVAHPYVDFTNISPPILCLMHETKSHWEHLKPPQAPPRAGVGQLTLMTQNS